MNTANRHKLIYIEAFNPVKGVTVTWKYALKYICRSIKIKLFKKDKQNHFTNFRALNVCLKI